MGFVRDTCIVKISKVADLCRSGLILEDAISELAFGYKMLTDS